MNQSIDQALLTFTQNCQRDEDIYATLAPRQSRAKQRQPNRCASAFLGMWVAMES